MDILLDWLAPLFKLLADTAPTVIYLAGLIIVTWFYKKLSDRLVDLVERYHSVVAEQLKTLNALAGRLEEREDLKHEG